MRNSGSGTALICAILASSRRRPSARSGRAIVSRKYTSLTIASTGTSNRIVCSHGPLIVMSISPGVAAGVRLMKRRSSWNRPSRSTKSLLRKRQRRRYASSSCVKRSVHRPTISRSIWLKYGVRSMPGVRHLKRYSTCAPGKMVQHDLHHRELVQVGIEQRLDDHAAFRERRKGSHGTRCRRGYPLSPGGGGDPKRRGERQVRTRWQSRAGAAIIDPFTNKATIHAGQLRRLSGRQEGRRHPEGSDQRLLEAPRLLRLGGAEGSDAGRARGNAGGIRPAGPRRRGRSARPSAAQDRGVRRLAVRRSAGGGNARRRAARRRDRHLRRPQLRAVGAPRHRAWLCRRARQGANTSPSCSSMGRRTCYMR